MRTPIFFILAFIFIVYSCDPCYNNRHNQNCPEDTEKKGSYTLHMTVHPHLDAYWIFNFQSYYDPQPNQGQVIGYFAGNRFSSVKQIFTTAKKILWESKIYRETVSNHHQKAHRSFVNSQMGFFKHWYMQQTNQDKQHVKTLLGTKYWQILGGGWVEHDQGCAYYDDIIENYQLGLKFLKDEFNYIPRVAISADSFGHSQSTAAILAQMGFQGFFVQRSDEHILLQNKTEFIWKAESANGRTYGTIPTHIRWAIHGFEDQFIPGNINEDMCNNKQMFMQNLRRQNQFLKRILKSNHIMRYFGHDFQKFDQYSYTVMESMMKKFSLQKCNRVTAVYGNPTDYFMTLMGEVFGKKVKPVVTRSEDIFPIWDYDSGLYWTGYLTTDPYHKKDYRDMGRLLHGVRKIFTDLYLGNPNTQKMKNYYDILQQTAQQVSYLQHHDGVSGTSKYKVMDRLEQINDKLRQQISPILGDAFSEQFPKRTTGPLFQCHLGKQCKIPQNYVGDIYLKIINTDASPNHGAIIVELPPGKAYHADCKYEINCFCVQEYCPCKMYLYKNLYIYNSIRIKLVDNWKQQTNKLKAFVSSKEYSYNTTHFTVKYNDEQYHLGYKKVNARATPRNYDHLSRFGTQYSKSFSIRPGKYALGNDPNQVSDFSEIKRVSQLNSAQNTFFIIHWKRYGMKTLITIAKNKKNQWMVQTISAAQAYYLSDLYFEVQTPIKNQGSFYTDSNGLLVLKRQLFRHEDYQAYFCKQKYDDIDGNTYPASAFIYLKNQKNKVSVNLDRPQGVIAYREGTIWVNFDRLSQDDGKWVYESTIRNQYQKYTHIVTVDNQNYNERTLQRLYDQPLFIQGNTLAPDARVELMETDTIIREQWNAKSNINDIKFSIRPYNDSTTIVRVQNMHDEKDTIVGLYADKISPFLTTYYSRSITFDRIQEASLGGNMNYDDMLSRKWNWNQVIDLSKQHAIFNKDFRQNITLRPLQIRTFLFRGLKFSQNCSEPDKLTYKKTHIEYLINQKKDKPKRDLIAVSIQAQLINFNQNGNRCDGKSPIVQSGKINVNIDLQNPKLEDTRHKQQPLPGDPINIPPPPAVQHSQPASSQLQMIKKLIDQNKILNREQKTKYFQAKLQQIRNKKK